MADFMSLPDLATVQLDSDEYKAVLRNVASSLEVDHTNDPDFERVMATFHRLHNTRTSFQAKHPHPTAKQQHHKNTHTK